MTEKGNHGLAITLKDHYSLQGVYWYFAAFVTCWPCCQSSAKVFRSPFAASLWHKFGLNIKTLPQTNAGALAGEVVKPFSYKSSFPPGRDRETLPDISLLHAQPYRWALHRMPLIHNHKVILILPSEHSTIIWLLGWYLPPHQHPFDINCCQMLF